MKKSTPVEQALRTLGEVESSLHSLSNFLHFHGLWGGELRRVNTRGVSSLELVFQTFDKKNVVVCIQAITDDMGQARLEMTRSE